MKYKNIAVMILIAVAFMAVAVWAQTRQSTPRVTQWEYKIISHSIASPRDELNEEGAQGWELIGVVTHTSETYAYFKRPK